MNITLYKAKLNTANKTPEQVKKNYDDMEPSEAEIQNYIKACNIIDGAEVLVMKSWTGDGYTLASWTPDDDNKFKEFIYQVEQDPLFGTYIDEREEFDKDWKTGDYSPSGSIVFDDKDVEIIEELKKGK